MKTTPNENGPLLGNFPATSPEAWRVAAEALLKGKPFDKVMTASTPEGIHLKPIFQRSLLDQLPAVETLPGFDGYLRGTSASGYHANPWEIAQELPYGTAEAFNDAARADLMRGQNALNILLDLATLNGLDPDSAKPGEVGACGLSIACLKDLETAFDSILPEAISFHFRTGCSGLVMGSLFFAWLAQQAVDPKKVRGSFGFDPLGVKAASGKLPADLNSILDEQAILAQYCSEHAPAIRAVGVSTLPYHQAGASTVDELAIGLATGAHYLCSLIDRGLSVDAAAQQIRFSFSIGPNFFMEIAKFRAARVLWAQVVQAFGGDSDSQKIVTHARTGLYNKTQKDPYVNMLRTTTEALSAAIAGVDSLCVGCFDEITRVPDTFSRRIARNTQIILQEECELTSVGDPAGGAWAVEWLTNEICQKSWSTFKEIEASGGIAESLIDGSLPARIAKTAQENTRALGNRRRSLIGTNVYPNLKEPELTSDQPDYTQIRDQRARDIALARMALDVESDAAVLKALGELIESDASDRIPSLIHAATAGATVGEMSRTLRASAAPDSATKPLTSIRLATPYEHLRIAAARFAKKTGRAPAILLTNLGPLRQHKARADFTVGFFETGGFEVTSPVGVESPEAAVAALIESGAGITVVCGTDDDYAAHFTEYAQAIKSALPNMQVILAGFPGDNEPAYRDAGMDDYIFIKSDNYEKNRHYLEGLGVL